MDADRSGLADQVGQQRARVRARLSGVRRIVPVMSGKGGVGKSFVSACIAAELSERGHATGLLDADLNGASARRLLNVGSGRLDIREGAILPPSSPGGVKLMSMDLLLEDGMPVRWRGPDSESFVWRGAQERSAVREFMADVAWGELDFLIVDLPPGGHRLVDVTELVEEVAGCLVVTIPSEVSRRAVERTMRLAAERGVPLVGVVENMSGYVCPSCGAPGPLFAGAAGRELARAFETKLLARIPFDSSAAELADRGDVKQLLADTAAGAALRKVSAALVDLLAAKPEERS